MSSSILLGAFSVLVIFTQLLITPTIAQEGCSSKAEYCWNCDSDIENYTSTTTYKSNLNKLLTSISSDTQNSYGFYNSSLGEKSNKVNAIAMCRGDIAQDKCRTCLNETNYRLLKRCPNKKEAIIWDELCMVRYSNNSIFHIRKDVPLKTLPSPNAAANGEEFKLVLKPLLDDLKIQAASGNSTTKFAVGNDTVPNAEGIFALVQCTPDLNEVECNGCLDDAILQIPDCCGGKQGGRVLKPSCNLRFESGPFYNEPNVNKPGSVGTCSDDVKYCWSCTENGNSNTSSIFKQNLNTLLLSNLTSNTKIDYGFYNSSVGENSNKVNGIALCRGDIEMDICHKCINESSHRLLENCPNRMEAIIWEELCMVRYSNKPIFSVMKDEPIARAPSPNKAWDPNKFMLVLKPLLDSLIGKASSGNSQRKFSTENETVPGYETIYALTQCTPDITKQECSDCLQGATLIIPECCDGVQGARILKPSCSLRYEVTPFYNYTADDSPAASPPSKGRKSDKTLIIVLSVVLSVTAILLLGLFFFLSKRRSAKENFPGSDEISWMESLQYNFGTIEAATDNFSDANKLGEGGFGTVYKGRLSNGQYIAVKRLSMNSNQGDLEFKNEVMLVAKLQHRNLVRLLGFCLEGSERLLVYEFVPNASLNQIIFDPIKRGILDWNMRYKIIGGISRGLVYLHEDSRLKIIHRDLKTGNILLDEDMNAKIADFGMARLFVVDQSAESTKRIVGTYGYMAPEYAMHGQFSVKSDVYSFGVLLLEIVTGQKISTFHQQESNAQDLLTYTWLNWREGTAMNIVDPTLRSDSSRNEIMRCIHIALLCVQENPADRPTMNSIVVMLTSYSVTLARPSEPAFLMHSSTLPDMSLASGQNSAATESNISKSGSIEASINDASITSLYPR